MVHAANSSQLSGSAKLQNQTNKKLIEDRWVCWFLSHDPANFPVSCFAIFPRWESRRWTTGWIIQCCDKFRRSGNRRIVYWRFFVLCVVIYILYRLLKDPRIHPAIVHVSPAQDVTNQNGASCPHCRNVPRSPAPAYNEVFPMEECACCTSTPPANTNWYSLTDLLTQWLIDSLHDDWLTNWLTALTYKVTNWLTD